MNLITLTLNPAFDLHCYTETFHPFLENGAELRSRDVGGKGVNISRALLKNGIKSTAYLFVGDQNGREFLEKLSQEGLSYRELFCSGRIRENITLHTKSQPETRISFTGFRVKKEQMSALKALLLKEPLGDAIVTFSGRGPQGVETAEISDLLKDLQTKGAKIVIDSQSFGKNALIAAKPWLIKPNQEEISRYVDGDVTDPRSAATAAKQLQKQGISNVLISLGEAGAVLCSEEGSFYAAAPKVEPLSTIGAGDSAIAGFIAATQKGGDVKTALKTAVAYGSAACMTAGTTPPDAGTVEDLLNRVTVVEL